MADHLRRCVGESLHCRFLLTTTDCRCQNITSKSVITHYSPNIFATLGIRRTDLRLFTTNLYGVEKTVGRWSSFLLRLSTICASGRLSFTASSSARCPWQGLCLSSAVRCWVLASPQLYTGRSIMKTEPFKNNVTPSDWCHAAMVCISLYRVMYCTSWRGVTRLCASEEYPLHIRSVSSVFKASASCVPAQISQLRIPIANEAPVSFVISRPTPYMITDLGCGNIFFFRYLLELMGF